QPVSLGGPEERLDLVDGQALADLVMGRGDLDELRDIAGDQLLAHGVLERVAQHRVDELNLSRAGPALAAPAGRTAPPLGWPVPVPPVGAAQTFLLERVRERLHVLHL